MMILVQATEVIREYHDLRRPHNDTALPRYVLAGVFLLDDYDDDYDDSAGGYDDVDDSLFD